MPKVPWLPKKTPFIESDQTDSPQHEAIVLNRATRPVPSLVPLALPKDGQVDQDQADPDQADQLHTQIRFNASAMNEIEALRAERQRLLAENERAVKQCQMFQSKLMRASEKLDFLQKKVQKSSRLSSIGQNTTVQPQVAGNGEPNKMAPDVADDGARIGVVQNDVGTNGESTEKDTEPSSKE